MCEQCHKALRLGYTLTARNHVRHTPSRQKVGGGDHGKAKGGTRPQKKKGGATQSTKMHRQTNQLARPRADLHWGCKVRPVSQTRNLSTCLRARTTEGSRRKVFTFTVCRSTVVSGAELGPLVLLFWHSHSLA